MIRVKTYTTECDSALLEAASREKDLAEGRYVTIEVTDTGCGMDDATEARIFDPFFTTKHTGRGLGLSVIHGIVRGHEGVIRVESEPGNGTTFKVMLPALDHPAEPVDRRNRKENDWHSTGTILVVDDEEMVRAILRRMLTEFGFSVLMASDGIEAIDLFRERHSEIDCILLDLTMPHMSGHETFEEIRKISEKVPVLLTSGYSEQHSIEEFADKGLSGFIQKPLGMAALSEKLREILGDSK